LKTSPHSTHVCLAVVLQVRNAELQALLWQRARDPDAGAWALPGGYLDSGETLEHSIRRHLAAKVDVRELSHLEQLGTWSDPDRHPRERQLATAYLGLVPTDVDPAVPEDTAWQPVGRLPQMAFDHGEIVLAPPSFTIPELRELYTAALGYEVSATNLQRVLLRRELLAETGERRQPGPHGGRPATVFRFRSRELEVTDQFAVLRPPTSSA
jgi:ADP-ribose pyrophosphatase YjhB (NUDIX family)